MPKENTYSIYRLDAAFTATHLYTFADRAPDILGRLLVVIGPWVPRADRADTRAHRFAGARDQRCPSTARTDVHANVVTIVACDVHNLLFIIIRAREV